MAFAVTLIAPALLMIALPVPVVTVTFCAMPAFTAAFALAAAGRPRAFAEASALIMPVLVRLAIPAPLVTVTSCSTM